MMESCYGKECKEVKWAKRFKSGYVLQRELITLGTSSSAIITEKTAILCSPK